MARKHRQGFTLIELMVVIVILGLIAGIAWQLTTDRVPLAKWDTTRTEMGELYKALEAYSLSNDGDYPENLEEIAGQFSGGRVPKDAFSKEPYIFERTDSGFLLTSYGSDGQRGGDAKPEADIIFNERGQLEPAE